MRRATVGLAAAGVLMAALSCRSEAMSQDQYRADFDYLWTQLRDRYAYFDEKQTDWNRVRALYRPQVAQVEARDDFVRLLERVLEELYDSHTHLQTHLADSPNIVPSRADLWAEWIGNRAVITAVRPGFVAASAGVQPGMEVVAVDGMPIAAAVQERLPRALSGDDPAAWAYALRKVVAGRRGAVRRLTLRQGDEQQTVALQAGLFDSLYQVHYQGRIAHRVVEGRFGYINIVNALGDRGVVPLFDQALAVLAHTEGLIVDLRQTPNGGDFAILQGLMGRFLAEQRVTHRNFPRRGRAYFSTVAPRGPWRYDKPLVLLVGRWTASAGEGMASSMDYLGAATVVGTGMGGLEGSVFVATLPHTGIRFQSSDTRILNGTLQDEADPSSFSGTRKVDYRPSVLVDLADPRYADVEDPILQEGLRVLGEQGSAGP